jgi:DNA-binding NarL/FixJ family response regulator
MARSALSARDRKLIEEAKEQLIPLDPSLPSVMVRALPLVSNLTGASFAGSYCPKRTTEGWDLDFGYGYLANGRTHEFEPSTRQVLTQVIRSAPPGMSFARVEREDQNQVASLRGRLGDEVWSQTPVNRAVLPALGLDLGYHDLRVLLAERGVLLAWMGAYAPEAFTDRARLMFQAMVPEIRRAAVTERTLGKAALDHAALLAALEAIPTSAYLTDGSARVAYANELGRRAIEALGRDKQIQLAQWVQKARNQLDCPEATVTPLCVSGLRTHYLLVERAAAPQLALKASEAATRWALTPRQGEILSLVLQGDSNKTIATTLDLGLRTVEHHVSGLMNKADVPSRAALIRAVLDG